MNVSFDGLGHPAGLVLGALFTLFVLVAHVIGFVDSALGAAMDKFGVPENAQTVLLAVAAIVLAMAALRALGRVVAALVLIFLVLVFLHHGAPDTVHFNIGTPPGGQPSQPAGQSPALNLPGPKVSL